MSKKAFLTFLSSKKTASPLRKMRDAGMLLLVKIVIPFNARKVKAGIRFRESS